jgi:hypothetical protein
VKILPLALPARLTAVPALPMIVPLSKTLMAPACVTRMPVLPEIVPEFAMPPERLLTLVIKMPAVAPEIVPALLMPPEKLLTPAT